MGKIPRLNIEPKILSWVIERRGFDVAEYAQKNERFGKWLTGEAQPTFRQAEDFAKSNYVPMGYLYLSEPPKEIMPIPFFRSKKGKMVNLNVMDAVKLLAERQTWLSGYLRSENVEKLGYVGSVQTNMNISSVANSMHELLGLRPDWALSMTTPDKAINTLAGKMEELGCVVVFNSTVGFSTSRSINVTDCRGFCLVDSNAPFIFINSKDAKQAQLFTLVHEFAHILLGFSAGTGNEENMKISQEELYCDKLAAVFLAPADIFIALWKSTNGAIPEMVKRLKVSRWVIARRAKELGLMPDEEYWALVREWQTEPHVESARKSGPVAFAIRAVRTNGRSFLAHVNNALNSHKLLYRDAYRLTGMKGDSLQAVMKSDYYLGL